jgi:hypothetical protein
MKDKLEIKKGVQMMNLLNNKIDVAFCEICDNYTPRLWVDEFAQECCELCYNAYGECN